MPGHSRAAPGLQARAREAPHNVDDLRSAQRVLRRRTYFVENEHETLSLRFAPAYLLYQPAATLSLGQFVDPSVVLDKDGNFTAKDLSILVLTSTR